ncbi:MAG: class D sortase [Chloroflexota bacterium]
MARQRDANELSISELEQLLYRKKRTNRKERLRRMKDEGRLVEVENLPPPDPNPIIMPAYVIEQAVDEDALEEEEENGRSITQWLMNKTLLFVEIAAVIGLAYVLLTLWTTRQDLNSELAQIQQEEAQSLALPTPTARPVIDVAILPTGHRFVEGGAPIPIESGDIPEHLIPTINNFQPPPPPAPAPEHARRIQIPAIGVDSTIVAGVYDWEQLKKGVGHRIGSAQPGEEGNMVLAAHNDIYGEIFRHLDKLSVGDEIIVSTERNTYTYVVNDLDIVDPVEGVHVMDQTDHASTTLISCYPYQVNTERIVVFADLVTTSNQGVDG